MLTVTDLFCGAGGSSIGAESVPGVKLIMAANHWRKAVETHQDNFPDAAHDCADVSQVDFRRYRSSDILLASPECFPAGTLILTQRGLVPIEEVHIGDKVLTHCKRWRPVTATMRRAAATWRAAGWGNAILTTTAEHPVWARTYDRVRDGREPGEPEWVAARDLVGLYWASPIEFPATEPPPVGGRGAVMDERFWWMIGRWLGDGSLRLRPYVSQKGGRARKPSRPGPAPCIECGHPATSNRRYQYLANLWCGRECRRVTENRQAVNGARGSDVEISCGYHQADAFEEMLNYAAPSGARAGGSEFRWRRRNLRTAALFSTSHNGLVNWLLENFGNHAYGKRIPSWAFGMDRSWQQALLDGYVSADGHHSDRVTDVSTVSKALAVGVRLLASSLGELASLRAPTSRSEGVIEGRIVKMRPLWSAAWTTKPDPVRARTFRDDGYRWGPVRSVGPTGRVEPVWNLSVEDDESYIADGIVVHNCTNHTSAKGVSRRAQREDLFDIPDPSAVRSRATMWDVHRYIEIHRPAAVVVENVVEAASWLYWVPWWSAFEAAGYEAKLLNINSMHVPGRVPQSRDRIYVVATRRGIRPDLNLRPECVCENCGPVYAVQSFKRRTKMAGRYSRSYTWRCPTCGEEVRPQGAATSEAIDWTLPSQRIGDRKRPLAAATLRRIEAGLERWGIP